MNDDTDHEENGPEGEQAGSGPAENADERRWDFDQVRAVVSERHGIQIEESDPVAVTFTILEVFLSELDKTLEEFRTKIEKLVSRTGEATAGAVNEVLEALKTETLDQTIQNTLSRLTAESKDSQEIIQRMAKLRNVVLFLAGFCGLSVFFNILLLIRSHAP